MNSLRTGLLAICLWNATLFPCGVEASTNVISGPVTNNATWTGTNLLLGTVTVTGDAVVTIAAGTRMLMNTGATLVVNGQLLAEGTAAEPIFFTRATTSARWSRLRFVNARPSRLRHCVIEFANSAGTHLDYYDNDCNTNTVPPNRSYHEAVVAIASQLELDGCIFRNLPDTGAGAEGDAIAIVSDDPQNPGPASAQIRNCQFVAIGQGIHTRYSYVLVEGCVFSGKRGDNDDIDLYGESSPPPVIRFNTFLPGHEDKINPTRCSAIIYGNVINGSDDHGIVLRDKCAPVVFNNLIYNCTSAGISVQNQCDALIAHNTIVGSQRGIRFFDHFDRHGPPYCLFPGSGRATIVNCIIWDCANSLVLTDSPDGHSFADVSHCDIEGGRASASVSANSTLVWGPGNLDSDPRFVGPATNNYRLLTGSPCIDAGTNVSAVATNFTIAVANDFDGVPRPLDGDGSGVARFDVGAHEFLLAGADSNNDGVPDGWTWQYGLNPVDPAVAAGNPDGDPHTTGEEWIADTNPIEPQSWFRLAAITGPGPVRVYFPSSSNRLYSLLARDEADEAGSSTPVPGQTDVRGTGGVSSLVDTNEPGARRFYRIGVRVP